LFPLSEGTSVRSVERLTGIHQDTIMWLDARVGRDCAVLHDMMMRDLPISLIEPDELWSYVGEKQRRALPTDGADVGDQNAILGAPVGPWNLISADATCLCYVRRPRRSLGDG